MPGSSALRRVLVGIPLCLIATLATVAAAEKIGRFGDEPALLSQKPLPAIPQPSSAPAAPDSEPEKAAAEKDDGPGDATTASRPRRERKSLFRKRGDAASKAAPESVPEPTKEDVASAPPAPDAPEAPPCPTPPAPEGVETYRMRLESRLLERYNNLPEHANTIGRVVVVLSRPLETSIDGRFIKAEFDQLVYDIWGKRLPLLEQEYFVVTFGAGGAETVRSDPGIRVGLDLEKTYSERAPLVADPFRNVPESEAFRSTPRVTMPEWWRPNFPELD